MDIFDFVFPLFMILFPAGFSLFIRQRQDDPEQQRKSRRLKWHLWAWTGVAAVAYLLLSRWQPVIAYFMFLAFFPLWFLLAMPLLQARDPGWGPLARDTVRSASLVRRDVLPPQLRVGWIAITALWGLILCVSILGLALAAARPPMWWLLAFNLMAGLELWLLHWAMRRSLIEPEPTTANESDALRAERESFHRFKLYAWFILAAVMMLIFSLPSLILIWYGNQALLWAIAIGAGGGTLVGIGGGVFGTLASIKRAKINRLHIEAAAQE